MSMEPRPVSSAKPLHHAAKLKVRHRTSNKAVHVHAGRLQVLQLSPKSAECTLRHRPLPGIILHHSGPTGLC